MQRHVPQHCPQHCHIHVNTALWDYNDLVGKNCEKGEKNQFQQDKASSNVLIKIKHFCHLDEWRMVKVPIVHCLHYLSGCHNVNSADE